MLSPGFMGERYRQGVMAVLVNDENKVLIGSSPRDGGYKFPQGGLDDGETPRDAIKREVMEEIGLQIRDEDIVAECSEKVRYRYERRNPNLPDDIVGQEQVVFRICYKGDGTIYPQDNEFYELVWVDPQEIEQHDIRHRCGAYVRALELCGLR